MWKCWAIFERELKSYFTSPIAYIVIAIFTALTGIFFYLILSSFSQRCYEINLYSQQWGQVSSPMNLHEWVTRPFFGNITLFALMILPLITMKLYAEEKKNGTIELLHTSPISSIQLVVGKFAASLVLYLLMLVLSFLYILFLFIYGDPELNQILSGYLGLLLIGASYLSIGFLFSTFTDNQIIAAVSTIAMILFFWSIGWLIGFLNSALGNLFNNFSLIYQFEGFAKGVIETKSIFFYLSFIIMCLYFCYISIESGKWRGSK